MVELDSSHRSSIGSSGTSVSSVVAGLVVAESSLVVGDSDAAGASVVDGASDILTAVMTVVASVDGTGSSVVPGASVVVDASEVLVSVVTVAASVVAGVAAVVGKDVVDGSVGNTLMQL